MNLNCYIIKINFFSEYNKIIVIVHVNQHNGKR